MGDIADYVLDSVFCSDNDFFIDHYPSCIRRNFAPRYRKAAYKLLNEGICPICKHKLVDRINKKTNSKFLGCSNFPKCKFSY